MHHTRGDRRGLSTRLHVQGRCTLSGRYARSWRRYRRGTRREIPLRTGVFAGRAPGRRDDVELVSLPNISRSRGGRPASRQRSAYTHRLRPPRANHAENRKPQRSSNRDEKPANPLTKSAIRCSIPIILDLGGSMKRSVAIAALFHLAPCRLPGRARACRPRWPGWTHWSRRSRRCGRSYWPCRPSRGRRTRRPGWIRRTRRVGRRTRTSRARRTRWPSRSCRHRWHRGSRWGRRYYRSGRRRGCIRRRRGSGGGRHVRPARRGAGQRHRVVRAG